MAVTLGRWLRTGLTVLSDPCYLSDEPMDDKSGHAASERANTTHACAASATIGEVWWNPVTHSHKPRRMRLER